jgi:hypothetical protein
MVVHTCHPSNGKKHKIGQSQSRLAWAKVRPYLKNNQSMAQEVEDLPHKVKALSSNSITIKERQRAKERK